jgi:hypothetical protein
MLARPRLNSGTTAPDVCKTGMTFSTGIIAAPAKAAVWMSLLLIVLSMMSPRPVNLMRRRSRDRKAGKALQNNLRIPLLRLPGKISPVPPATPVRGGLGLHGESCEGSASRGAKSVYGFKA